MKVAKKTTTKKPALRRLDFAGMLTNISNRMVSTTSQLDLYSMKKEVQVLRVGVQVKDREALRALAKLEGMLDDRIMNNGRAPRRRKTVKQEVDELKDLEEEIARLRRKE